ncbi:MAG: Rieske 2Fe-2S domain-containing protein [Acidimicrobiales bacterium]
MVVTAEQNRRLTEVGRGTPMGELLRRYWHPVAAESEFTATATKAVRFMGEDLVLYRTTDGSFGLIEPHCPHRRAGLVHGYAEADGIRCSYHGWKFDLAGRCLEQPFEDAVSEGTRFRDSIRALTYRAEARFGLVWAYLGPAPAPLIPTWEPFTFENCFTQVVFHLVGCNWLQAQENSIDPVHFEWLHNNWHAGRAGQPERYAPRHVELGFEEWEYGFMYRRRHEGEDHESDAWRTGRLSMMPNLFAPLHFEWRVPVDDVTTLSVIWHTDRVTADREPYVQEVIPHWWGRHADDDGNPLTTHVLGQDVASWTGQGPITDRTREHLGRSDRGVQMFRRRLEADLAAVERGDDPSGLVRDPAENECIRFPNDIRQGFLAAPAPEAVERRLAGLKKVMPGSRPDDHFFLLEGQPDHIRQEWEWCLGLRDDRGTSGPPLTARADQRSSIVS